MLTGCIIALYFPDKGLLDKVIGAVATQVDAVFLADNTPQPYYAQSESALQVIHHKFGKNRGIAAAQNRGIRYFLEQSYNYVVFLDQDSIAEEGMVQKLIHTHEFLVKQGIQVGAVGPRHINRDTKEKYEGWITKGEPVFPHITEIRDLMSSGSLISAEALWRVGDYEEDLFMANVDSEWCWRGKYQRGYRFFICEQTQLSHKMGESDRQFFFRKISIPAPPRLYYTYRAYFRLLRRHYVPLMWKLVNTAVLFGPRLFYYAFCITPRREYCRNILLGIRDGIFKTKFVKRNSCYEKDSH